MDYRKSYESLLKKQCESYRKMLRILEMIDEYDKLLAKVSSENRPNPDFILAIATQKERELAKLDNISLDTEEVFTKLENTEALCPELRQQHLYKHMEDLQMLVHYKISEILDKEETDTPAVIDNLNEYKESLELDMLVGQVPPEKRQVFIYVPDRKK